MRSDRDENSVFEEVGQGVRWMHHPQMRRLPRSKSAIQFRPIHRMQMSAVFRTLKALRNGLVVSLRAPRPELLGVLGAAARPLRGVCNRILDLAAGETPFRKS